MEFLTKQAFKKNMQELKTVFNYKTTDGQMELYYKYLRNKFEDDIFMLACKDIILKEHFFPSISVFLKRIPKFLSGAF